MNYKLAFALGLIAPGTWVGREQWETVFEGTVETGERTDSDTGRSYGLVSFATTAFSGLNRMESEQMRLTIDGKSRIYWTNYPTVTAYMGNSWLNPASDENDDGFDLYIAATSARATFYTRISGTHIIKVEREVR